MTTPPSSALLTPEQCDDVAECGGKARGLALAATVAQVPEFVVVPASWFESAAAVQWPAVDQACTHLATEGEAALADVVVTIEQLLAGLDLTPRMHTQLDRAVAGFGQGVRFAVRSSATTEDGERRAAAGVYESVLHVAAAEVARAVLVCWKSAFSPGALRQQVLHGDRGRPGMAVVVQPMVPAARAGVAFSVGADRVAVEAVDGLADGLVAGRSGPGQHAIVESPLAPDLAPELVAVREVVLRLRDAFAVGTTTPRGPKTGPITAGSDSAAGDAPEGSAVAGDVDVEWVWDGFTVHVVQVRRVTAPLPLEPAAVEQPGTAVLRVAQLYGDAQSTPRFDLGAVEPVYRCFRSKRLVLTEIATWHGCQAGAAIVLRYNRAGLAGPDWQQLLERLGAEVNVDAGADARQIITSTASLTDTLIDHLAHQADPEAPATVLVREFLRGDCGALSHLVGDSLRVEWSTDGLLAINRGLTINLQRFVAEHGALAGPLPPGWTVDTVARVRAVTEDLAHRGACLVEWISENGRVRAIDYSPTGATFASDVFTHGTTISPGSGDGPALVIADTMIADLEASSTAAGVSVSDFIPAGPPIPQVAELQARVRAASRPPVVVVDRPYAVLAVLIGEVAGFVFRGPASLLCHLAILLREHDIPAVSADDLEVTDGQLLTLPGDGEVRVEGHHD